MSWIKITTQSFSAVNTVSIDNCFSANYVRYKIFRKLSTSSDDQNLNVRLRTGGSDATGSDYDMTYLQVNGTTVVGARTSNSTSWADGLGYAETTATGFFELEINDPFAVGRTSGWNNFTYDATGNIRHISYSYSHGLSTSYDGFTVFAPGAVTMTGSITVYGLRES